MNAEERKALEAAQGYAKANRVRLTDHADRQLRTRGGVPADAISALANATNCKDQRTDASRAGDWLISGPDLEGDELACAVTFEDGVWIITAF